MLLNFKYIFNIYFNDSLIKIVFNLLKLFNIFHRILIITIDNAFNNNFFFRKHVNSIKTILLFCNQCKNIKIKL